MKFYNETPNLTILMPVGCNAKCSFCFWNRDIVRVKMVKYFKNLRKSLQTLPRDFRQVSLSGGEPTMLDSDTFEMILDYIEEFAPQINKIVLNTNGYKLNEFLQKEWFTKKINHINISRHNKTDKANSTIFGCHTVPTKEELIDINELSNMKGIDVTANFVYDNNRKLDVKPFVMFAREVGFSSVSFRQNIDNGLDISKAQKMIEQEGYSPMYKGECIVCSATTYRIGGIPVSFKYGVMETNDKMKFDTIYEGIIHTTGELSTDWDYVDDSKFTDTFQDKIDKSQNHIESF